MSRRFRLDLGDVWSGVRHVVFPSVGYGLTLLAERLDPEQLFSAPSDQALAATLLAGAARLLQRLVSGPKREA